MRRILSTLILTLLGYFAAFAQPTLEECKEKAIQNYPLVKKFEVIAKTEAFSIATASQAWLPQIGFSAQATYQSDVVAWPDSFKDMLSAMDVHMEGLRKDQYKVALDIYQNIWDGGKAKSDKEIAEYEAEISSNSMKVELSALESRIEEMYFGILLLQEQKNLIEESIERLDNNYSYIQALVENGVATQSDADALQVQILTTNQSLTQVNYSIISFRKMLGIIIGEPLGDGELSVPEAVEPIDNEPERFELDLFDSQIKLLEARKKSINNLMTPKLGLFAQGYYGYPGLNMFQDMVSHEWSLNGIVGVKMSWNIGGLFSSKLNKLKLDNAIYDVQVSKEAFLYNNSIQAEAERIEIQRIREALQDDDKIVQLRTKVRQAAEVKLQEGVIDMNDLLGKISDETTARIARSTRELELIKAIYNLKHTLNK